MEQYVVKFLKPICLALICAVSVFYLTKSISLAVTISMVPLLLGWLALMQGFAYGLSIVLFLMSTAWAVTPVEIKDILRAHATLAIDNVNREMKAKQ